MELKKFEELLKGNNAIRLTEDLILFNDLELYSFNRSAGIQFKRFKDLYNYKLEESTTTIADLICATDNFKQQYDGGRGSSSANGKMGGGFNHAPRNGRKGKEYGTVKYPAEFNVGGRFNSYEDALKRFENKYADADIEYGITIDEQGYVHRHIQGGATSVGISGNQGEMVIHNHPSGGNFSDSDLISTASDRSAGIVATSSNTKRKARYTFRKNKNFKSKEFIKAVKKAQWPAHLSYDRGADWWLKKNQKQFGYTYTHTGKFD